MTTADDTRVEGLLAGAGAAAAWPATPDLRAAVVARIAVPATPDLRPAVVARIGAGPAARPGVPAPGRPLRLVRPLALAAVLLLVLAGLAAGLGLGLPGLDLERVDRTPAAGSGLDLGSPIPLVDALALVRPVVRLPATLPRPDTAWLLGAGEGSIVTVAWRAAEGEDTLAASDLSLTLTAVAGGVDEVVLRKLLGPGTSLQAVDVDGARGWWITGSPHELLVLDPAGRVGPLEAAVAGDTLVFARGGTLYRLESALGLDATLEIARSLR
jgi:hypothetical protein